MVHLTAWRNAVIAVFFVNGFGFASVIARVPAIRDHLGIDAGQVGLLIGSLSLGSIVGLVAAGPLLRLLGVRRMTRYPVLLAGVALAATTVGAAVVGEFWFTAVAAAAWGAGLSSSDVALNLTGAQHERAAERTLMPIFHAGFSAGGVIGAGFGALSAWAGVPVWAQGAVTGALVMVTAIVAPRWIPEIGGDEEARPTRAQRLAIWREPRTYLIGLVVFGFAYTEGGASDWLPLGLVDDRGFDPALAAAMYTVFMVCMTVGRIVGARLVDRIGRFPAVAGSAVVAAAGLAIVIFVPDTFWAIIGVVVWGLGAALGFPLGMSAAADDPVLAAPRVAAISIIGYSAFFVGPVIVGWIADRTSVLAALGLILALLALAGILSPATRQRQAGGATIDPMVDPVTAVGPSTSPIDIREGR